MNHFNNEKSLMELPNISREPILLFNMMLRDLKRSTDYCEVKKSAKKNFRAGYKRWILRKIKNNRKLSATKLAAEIEKHLHIEVIYVTFRRVLRKNNFDGRVYTTNGSDHRSDMAVTISIVPRL
jgi:hypothetical protein